MENHASAKRMLVLDDQHEVAATICMMAAAAGIDADHTADTNIFLEKAISWAPTHLVVDLQLGVQDGVEILQKLSALNCEAAVIVTSGLGDRILDAAARAATESGLRVAGILRKPFSRSVLLTMLANDAPAPAPRRKNLGSASSLTVTRETLAAALQRREFVTYFQPKISCIDGELVGFECLARWPQKSGTIIPPDSFIGLAEETGQIHDLTRQVFDYALSNLPAPSADFELKIALNLSVINLDDKEFPKWLLSRCEVYSIAPSRIILEVTESTSMENSLALLEKMTQFRIRGFNLSIDDFGVGHSSLVRLARLPFSELKIDKQFVMSLSKSEESQKIVSAMVGLGRSMGLSVVAEGVEDALALNYLRQIGCDQAQGYFIARPMEKLAANAWRSREARFRECYETRRVDLRAVAAR